MAIITSCIPRYSRSVGGSDATRESRRAEGQVVVEGQASDDLLLRWTVVTRGKCREFSQDSQRPLQDG
jgi:hypothetical protein